MVVVFFQSLVVLEFRDKIVIDATLEFLIVVRWLDLHGRVDSLLRAIDGVVIGDLDVQEASFEARWNRDLAPDLDRCLYSINCNRGSFVVEHCNVLSFLLRLFGVGSRPSGPLGRVGPCWRTG